MISPFKYELGTVLRDPVTNFEGVVMERKQYYTGFNHYRLLSQKMNEKGKPDEWQWLDESRLIPTGEKKVVLGGVKPSGGPCSNAPEA